MKRVAEDVRRTNRERLSRAAPAPKPVEPEPPIHTSKFARAREFAKKVPLPKSNAGGKPVAAASVAVAADVDDGSGDILDESSAAVAPAGAAASAVMDELNQKHEVGCCRASASSY